MTELLLTEDERKRFAGWCRRVIANAEAMERQIGDMRFPAPIMERMQQRERNTAAAYRFVLADLESVETVTISGAHIEERQDV